MYEIIFALDFKVFFSIFNFSLRTYSLYLAMLYWF